MTIRHPVHIIQSSDLEENGGRYKLMGGAVIPVDHSTLAVASAADDHLAGGALTPVYFVTAAELATSRFKLMGGRSERIFNEHIFTGDPSRGIIGRAAIPVYDPNFSPGTPDWWNPLGDIACIWAAYQPVGAANFVASLVDLSGNGNDAVDPGGAATPTWAAGPGWGFDGIAMYLTTTFVPANDQSQSAIVQVENGNAGTYFGIWEAAGSVFSLVNSGDVAVIYANGGNNLGAGGGPTAGNFGVAGNSGYENGLVDSGPIAAWGAVPTDQVYIAALNAAGVAGSFSAVDIKAFVIYDCALAAPQVLAVATAMAAL